MPSPITTSLLLPDYTGNFVANVIGADATATTFVLDCDFANDPEDCGLTKVSVTVGPWADKTFAPDADPTGVYHEYETLEDESFTFSVRCDMTRTFAGDCTTINIGGNDNDTPTATWRRDNEDDDIFRETFGYNSFTWVPVAITAGYDLLSKTHMASAETTSTNEATSIEAASTTGGNGPAQTATSVNTPAESLMKAGTEISTKETAHAAASTTSAVAPVSTSGSGSSASRSLTMLAALGALTLVLSL